jgi:metallophosphoesterase superfamily enzyme
MKKHKHFRTIVLSDIHLGTSGSKAKEATEFLKQYRCERLILNGDIKNTETGRKNTLHFSE